VVAEGSVGMDGVLKVSALGFPGCERREELPPTAQARRHTDTYTYRHTQAYTYTYRHTHTEREREK
jgi:hypothetical protein